MDIKEDMTEKEDTGTQVMEVVPPRRGKRVSVEIEAGHHTLEGKEDIVVLQELGHSDVRMIVLFDLKNIMKRLEFCQVLPLMPSKPWFLKEGSW